MIFKGNNRWDLHQFYDADGVQRCPMCGTKDVKPLFMYCDKEECRNRARWNRKTVKDMKSTRKRKMRSDRARRWREMRKEEGKCTRCAQDLPMANACVCVECMEKVEILRTR